MIKTITTPFIFNISVNCYLIEIGDNYILIDTGIANQRSTIEKELENAGCQSGNLKLIILTHGDIDHCGNASYFRQKFRTKIAMHYADLGMVERGDMFWNRQKPNHLMRIIFGLLFGLSKSDRFKPDLYIKDGDHLCEYGLDAQVLELPGHSKGSIGILTANGNAFCGDLLGNTDKPKLWSIIDDRSAASASVEKLKSLAINTVYPGHGESFSMKQFSYNN
ncbi:MBL fold metallo-hydrolase [Hyella patelloides LEGE 07179]|uniref:MBL fold metallo-hydrolase n=1 Tax=Hyella patelloides LEGE 07179 TaxID=945734 RepID=A0A563VL32_9CYAN|nr:MBL fold metallo-hydrolase [Hyella patelloides]VEP12160.1 MBL fold metallo-hydrolase [Hyella patelloides LEGE 07179]